MTSRFSSGRHDEEEDGTVSATLTTSNGLRKGANLLRVGIVGRDKHLEVRRVKFDYYFGLGAGQNLPNYLPSTVGFSLKSGGAQPWVSMTTGTPAGLQDNSDQTQFSLPYQDMTFPTANDTPCTTRYQVVVLNRQNPAVEDAYWCVNDAASLKSRLATLNQGTELVLVGTTEGNNADTGLDTTSIGGTNYSAPNSWQPVGYVAIGVSGAAPGSAYESYNIASDVGKAYQTNPLANGLLAVDQNGNYNFHAGDNVQFEVYPNNPESGTSLVRTSLSTGDTSKVYTWFNPPGPEGNGFWLLTLDRVTLLPIDFNQGLCGVGGSANCGQFFPTGSTDPNVAAQAATNLGQALVQPTNRQLVVLTTLGQPTQGGLSYGGLVDTITFLGGSGYTIPSLTTPTSTYTLIFPGIRPEPFPVQPLTPFSKGVVNSSSAFSQQGQTGIVRGVLARDNNSLYFPSVVSQEDGKGNADGASAVSIDYDFYSITSQNSVDWPLTDTSGHIAAYHWASQQFLQYERIIETGSHAADLRYFYGSSYTPQMIGHVTDFNCSVNSSLPNCVYSEGNGFTAYDLAEANAQLYTEVAALNGTYSYLDAPGIGGVIKGNSGVPSVSGQVIDASYEVLNGQVGASSSTHVKASSFDWMNLFAGVTSILAAGLGPADLPIVAAMTGIASGALWTGSALDPWWQGNSATPPSDENTFDTTLGQLSNNSDQYAISLAASYDTALDNIYSDWGKLSATGAKTANSDSGWQFNNELTSLLLGEKLAAGVRRSMYIQVLPQFYSLDTYTQAPVSNIDQLGMFYSQTNSDGEFVNSCTASYGSSISGWGWAHYANPSVASTTDIYVMDGVITNQGTVNVTESLPTDTLLNTLFTAPADNDQSVTGPLNIPYNLVFGASLLPNRQGPYMYKDIPQCYQVGCSDRTNPSKSKCINP